MKVKLARIFKHVVLISSLALFLASCRDNGCIYADDFGGISFDVNSNPETVYGEYPNQSTEWLNTGLRVTGDEVRIAISGNWVPWPAVSNTEDGIASVRSCLDRSQSDFDPTNRSNQNFGLCAKTVSDGIVSSDNCLCYKGESWMGMINSVNTESTTCSQSVGNNPDSCVCNVVDPVSGSGGAAVSSGTATEGDCIVHFTLSDKKKDMSLIDLVASEGHKCRFTKGLGLYMGLFGIGGNDQPKRVYHLFTQTEECPIRRDDAGRCVQEIEVNGETFFRDRTRYIYTNPTGRFIEDDMSGNSCSSTDDPSDDVYHSPREIVQLKIHDTYYRDNYGSYNVEFLSGFYLEGEMGILETIVNDIETILLGEVDLNNRGEREGGLLRFLYNAIVMNPDFTLFVQLTLVLYISFFGLSSLLGVTDITKRELMTKFLQIGIIMMFTSANGWQMYYDLFVKFFKYGMDQVINRISLFSNQLLAEGDGSNSVIRTAMLRSANPDSMGAKFAYVDGVIRMLFSEAITKKIWSLFFYSFFGFIYIFLIYCLIFYFLYTMSIVAFVYCIMITKMIIGLVLGPVFIIFLLFKQTNEYFRKWIAFLAARSLEAVMLFMIMFILVRMIDQKFNQLLYYSACIIEWDLWLFKFKWLVAQSSSLPGFTVSRWLMEIAEVAIVIYISKQIIMQIPKIAGGLISVGGASNSGGSSYASQGFAIAEGAMGSIFSSAKDAAAKYGSRGAGLGFRGLGKAINSTGIGKLSDKLPRGPRALIRDRIIDNSINKFANQASMKGLTGKDRDQFIRNSILNNQYSKNKMTGQSDKSSGLRGWASKHKNKAALLNIDTKTINDRLNNKLFKEPMKRFLKQRAEEYKDNSDPNKVLLGDKLKNQLKKDAIEWGKANSVVGDLEKERITNDLFNNKSILHDHVWFTKDKWGARRGFIDDLVDMGKGRAASKNRLGSTEEGRAKYLSHLRTKQFKKLYKGDGQNVTADKVRRKSSGSDQFTRRAHANEGRMLMNPLRSYPFNKFGNYDQAGQNYRSVRESLIGNDFQDRKSDISQWHEEEKDSARARFGGDLYKRQVDEREKEAIKKLSTERRYYKDVLKKEMNRNYTDAMKEVEKDSKAQKELTDRLNAMHKEVSRKVGERMLHGKELNGDNIRDGLVSVSLDKDFEINGKKYSQLTLFEANALIAGLSGDKVVGGISEGDEHFEAINRLEQEANEAADRIEKANMEESEAAESKLRNEQERNDLKLRIQELNDGSKEKERLEKMLSLQDKVEKYMVLVRQGSLSRSDKMMLKFQLETLLREDLTADNYARISELISEISKSPKPDDYDKPSSINAADVLAASAVVVSEEAITDHQKDILYAQAHMALDENNDQIKALYSQYHDEAMAEYNAIKDEHSALMADKDEFEQAISGYDDALKTEVEEVSNQLEISQEDLNSLGGSLEMMDEQVGDIIVTDLEVEFGKDITDALALDAGSIIIEGADISIGGGSGDDNTVDTALKNSYEQTIRAHKSKIKQNKNQIKYLEFDIQNLEKIINSDSSATEKSQAMAQKSSLEVEVSNLRSSVSREEGNLSTAETNLSQEVTYGKKLT